MSDSLPKFDLPPVNETVLGVSFMPLSALQVPHFGIFWSRIRHDYDKVSVQPPLPDEVGPPGVPMPIMINFGIPQPRCWFINEVEGWLIQVQNSRFISNWRKVADGVYPTYSKFEERFLRDWNIFQTFLEDEKLGQTQLTQVEVSYINHIEPEDVSKTFPVLSGYQAGSFLPLPTGFSLSTKYLLPNQNGQLTIVCQPVLRHADLKEVIQVTLTAKVVVASNDQDGIVSAFRLGHEWVVRGFTDFTTPGMHTKWERTQ